MFVSGTLKKKTVNFYREKIEDFDYNGFYVDEYSILYNGEISTTPWNMDELEKLKRRQEKHIEYILNNTNVLIKNAFFTDDNKNNLKNLLLMIRNTPRNITYILAENFYFVLNLYYQDSYNTLYHHKSKYKNMPPLKVFIDDFKKLISYFNTLKDLSQKDIETIIYLFLKKRNYEIELDSFILKQNGISSLYQQDINLYRLANFIAPERIKKVSYYFNRGLGNDYSAICLYFLLKDESLAEECLKLHFQNPEKELTLSRVPKHLIDLSKKHEPFY